MTPSQVFLGQTNINGQITGSNFTGIVAVEMGAGINIHKVEGIDSTTIKVKFSVSTNATTGPRTITVTNAAGKTSNSSALSITNNRTPLVAFTVDPPRGSKETIFTFDASPSVDPDGKISNYDWDFGNGQSGTGRVVTHSYNAAGSFHVTLTVTDNHQGKAQSTRDVVVDNNRAPIPHYQVSPGEGNTTTIFRFDGSRSTDDGRIVRYEWDLRDGSIKRGVVINHRFSRNTTYRVKLTVTDDKGSSGYLEKDLRIRGNPPVAVFQVSPPAGDSNTSFQFDASDSDDPDGEIARYEWNFGDGSTGNGRIINHHYNENGTYIVRLTVFDNGGQEGTTTRTVTVRDGAPPPSGGGQCKTPAKNRGFIFGTVIGVQGFDAIVQLPAGSTCANSFYKCGDMRRANPEQFRGIIKSMSDRGNNVFSVYNDCPFIWPPAIGERVFLYFKTCAQNYCP